MANYEQALSKLLETEGLYDNDPQDSGGETLKGISRNNFPKWEGWEIVDALKRQSNFQSAIQKNEELQLLVKDFYQVNFWSRIKGDSIVSQEVAESIFDFSVNAGVSTSASLAQLVAGVKSDGIIGKDSLTAINAMNEDHFLAAFTVAKIARYVNIVKKRPVSKKYFYGWVVRALKS